MTTGIEEALKRLQEATGPDRDLDLEILNALVPWGESLWIFKDRHRLTITRHIYGACAPGNPVCSLEEFTSSLDAALTLVPETADTWGVEMIINSYGAWVFLRGSDKSVIAGGATPAIALTSASLKARTHPAPGKDEEMSNASR